MDPMGPPRVPTAPDPTPVWVLREFLTQPVPQLLPKKKVIYINDMVIIHKSFRSNC